MFKDIRNIMKYGTTKQKLIVAASVTSDVLVVGGLVVLCTGVATKAAIVAGVTGGVLMVGALAAGVNEVDRLKGMGINAKATAWYN